MPVFQLVAVQQQPQQHQFPVAQASLLQPALEHTQQLQAQLQVPQQMQVEQRPMQQLEPWAAQQTQTLPQQNQLQLLPPLLRAPQQQQGQAAQGRTRTSDSGSDRAPKPNARNGAARRQRRKQYELQRAASISSIDDSGCGTESTTSGGEETGSVEDMDCPTPDNGARLMHDSFEEVVTAVDPHALVKEGFAKVSSGDTELVRAHIFNRSAPNCQLVWPDIGVDVRGPQNMGLFFSACMQAVPDLRLTVTSVVKEDTNSVFIKFTAEGTAQHIFLPMFALGKFTTWPMESRMTFNEFGKVTQHVINFVIAPQMTLMPEMLQGLSQSALVLSATPSGSRMLQNAIEMAGGTDHVGLMEQLRGHVWEAAGNPHGNHVLQKYITVMPPERVQFIVDEMKGRAVSAAQHRIRCRVLERLMEHCPQLQTAVLVDQLLAHGLQLSRHPFGNFVAQHIFEHGSPLQRSQLTQALLPELPRLARHRIASNVVRSALIHADPNDTHRLAQALTADAQDFASLAHHCIGSFVVRELKLVTKAGVATA